MNTVTVSLLPKDFLSFQVSMWLLVIFKVFFFNYFYFFVAFYCGQPKAHLCNNHAVIAQPCSILICHTCEVDGLSRERRSAH